MKILASKIRPGDYIFDPIGNQEIHVKSVEPLNQFVVVNKSEDMLFFGSSEQVGLLGGM